MKLGVATLCLFCLSAGSACAPEGAIEVERRHYTRPADDGPIHAKVGAVTLTLRPALHPRTELASGLSTRMTWVTDVDVSDRVASVRSADGGSIELGHAANVSASGFDLVLEEDELRTALTGTPVGIQIALESGEEIVLRLDVRASFLFRESSGPYVIGSILRPSTGPDLFFETTLDGPAIADLDVEAAVAPTLSLTGGAWRIGWSFDDLLTASERRNGAVDLDVTDTQGLSFEASATLAPAIYRVDVTTPDQLLLDW